jgi:hypothetical protein
MARIPRRVDEHTLTDRIRSLERRLAALETRVATAGLGDPSPVEEPASEASSAAAMTSKPVPDSSTL